MRLHGRSSDCPSVCLARVFSQHGGGSSSDTCTRLHCNSVEGCVYVLGPRFAQRGGGSSGDDCMWMTHFLARSAHLAELQVAAQGVFMFCLRCECCDGQRWMHRLSQSFRSAAREVQPVFFLCWRCRWCDGQWEAYCLSQLARLAGLARVFWFGLRCKRYDAQWRAWCTALRGLLALTWRWWLLTCSLSSCFVVVGHVSVVVGTD